jgi:phosphomannomutase
MENNKKLLDQLPTVDNKRKFFGTDGVRGTVGVAPMIPDTILALAHGAGRVFAQQHIASGHKTRPTVLIGKDTRVSGYMLESLLEAGFTSAGLDGRAVAYPGHSSFSPSNALICWGGD